MRSTSVIMIITFSQTSFSSKMVVKIMHVVVLGDRKVGKTVILKQLALNHNSCDEVMTYSNNTLIVCTLCSSTIQL
jgi:hypothetical protein